MKKRVFGFLMLIVAVSISACTPVAPELREEAPAFAVDELVEANTEEAATLEKDAIGDLPELKLLPQKVGEETKLHFDSRTQEQVTVRLDKGNQLRYVIRDAEGRMVPARIVTVRDPQGHTRCYLCGRFCRRIRCGKYIIVTNGNMG